VYYPNPASYVVEGSPVDENSDDYTNDVINENDGDEKDENPAVLSAGIVPSSVPINIVHS